MTKEVSVQEKYRYWHDHVDTVARFELDMLADKPDELADAFYRDLEFGTAGLRALIGIGTNRMNVYTVAQATQGLANYLKAHYDKPSVVLCRDNRNGGKEFIETACSVLAANGIRSYFYERIEPTPALSFALRFMHCCAGINITASHNPAEYNGYKVYDSSGCQISSQPAADIQKTIKRVDVFKDVLRMDFHEAQKEGLVSCIPEKVLDAFCAAVLETLPDKISCSDLRVVYTPLCGTGLECCKRIFDACKLGELLIVARQAEPDGDFRGCPCPNPEKPEALACGIDLAQQNKADLVIASDPDADRVGIAVAHKKDYRLLSGNELGCIMLDYICAMRKKADQDLKRAVAISTIVSSAMPDELARDYDFQMRRTLTGFKYIGAQITLLEQQKAQERFIFAFEESYGYLSGTHVRDKDAVNASLLICQMAQYYKERGLDLYEAMQALYLKYGFYLNRTINISYPGSSGVLAMQEIMDNLRSSSPCRLANHSVVKVVDYALPTPMPIINRRGDELQYLPHADVIEFQLSGHNKIIVRKSGTEPKIKAYLFAYAETASDAQTELENLDSSAHALLS